MIGYIPKSAGAQGEGEGERGREKEGVGYLSMPCIFVTTFGRYHARLSECESIIAL